MNGHRLVTLIVCVLIVVPAFGIRNVDALVRWLVKVNSVCMPLRYLWVFVAYIALKRAGDAFCGEYRFVKGKTAGILVGGWCFLFTAFACLTGIYSEDPFQLALNIVTPFVLVGLGFIMPDVYKRQLQRMFKIGFNRAARIMDQLAEAGVVGEEEGTKPRKVLMSMEEFEELLEQGY